MTEPERWRVVVIGDGIRLTGSATTAGLDALAWVTDPLGWLLVVSPPDPTPPLSGVGG